MRGAMARPTNVVWVIIVIALVLVGCAGVPPASRSSRGAISSATPWPTVAWRAVTPPQGIALASFVHQPGGATFAISPADGHDAWLCAPTTPGSFAIWATADAGATWRQVGTLAPSTPMPPSCTLTPDNLDPSTLAAVLSWGAGADGTLRAASWLSNDDGASWHAVPGHTLAVELATHAGITYSILHDSAPGSGNTASGIAYSTDGLRTWRITGPIGLMASDSLLQFWLSPTGRDLLAASYDNTLWHSGDGGATWARVTTPAMQISLGMWIASPPHWLLCGFTQTAFEISCSADFGTTWTPHPELANTYTCASCGKWGAPSGGTDHCVTVSIAPDSALLAACPPNGTVPGPANFALYRLAPGSAAWTMLGAAPGPWLTAPATGPLWCWNANTGMLVTTAMPGQ